MRVSSSAAKVSLRYQLFAVWESTFCVLFPRLGWHRPLACAVCGRSSGEKWDDLFAEQAERRKHVALLAHDMAEEEVSTAQRPVFFNLGYDFLGPADDEGLEFFSGEAAVSRLQDGFRVPLCRRQVR